jgi:autophagy-related protein 18
VATTRGVKIFSLDAGLECVFEHRMGACRIAEMLFRSSLLVVVGAGETHDMSPRRLKVFNTSTRVVIADLPFPDTIAAVRLDRQKLVVVEARRATVFDLATLAAQREMATAPNERGVVAMTADETGEFSLVALPADTSLSAFDTPGRSRNGVQERTPARAGSSGAAYASPSDRKIQNQNQNASRLGVVVVHDCLNHHAVCEIRAHRAPLAAMAFCGDGTRLATASERGTVVRVHALPAAGESDRRTFRRGVSSAVVRQLAFGAAPGGGLCLAASSEKGTVHVFELSASGVSVRSLRGARRGKLRPHTHREPTVVDVEARRVVVARRRRRRGGGDGEIGGRRLRATGGRRARARPRAERGGRAGSRARGGDRSPSRRFRGLRSGARESRRAGGFRRRRRVRRARRRRRVDFRRPRLDPRRRRERRRVAV